MYDRRHGEDNKFDRFSDPVEKMGEKIG